MNNRFYICEHCGNLIGMINDSGVPMVCCGHKMTELKPGTVEASHEKHIPVVKVEGNTAIIDGVSKYTGAHVSAPDLRAGAALVIAGLAAEGFTMVDDINYIQRGYEDFEIKLQNLGANIEKVTSEKEVQKFKLKVG